MGLILSGCDIKFVIDGDYENAIQMGTTLSSEQSSYESVARVLMQAKNKNIRKQLKDELKFRTSIREVTPEEIIREGIIHNSTVENIAKKYPEFGWDGLDQSVKILATDWFSYYGKDLSGRMIKRFNKRTKQPEVIIVINPHNTTQINALHSYLKAESVLKTYDENTQGIIENSEVGIILEQLQGLINALKPNTEEIEKLQKKQETERLLKSERNKLGRLLSEKDAYEGFKNGVPKDAQDLLLDYLQNKGKYDALKYKVEGGIRSVSSHLEGIVRTLEGKKVKEATFNDVFANEIVSRSRYSPSKNLNYISKPEFIVALSVKLEDLEFKRQTLKDDRLIKQSKDLEKKISNFISKENKTAKDWNLIINLLIEQTDDEFSYALASIEKNMLYLKSVPKTLEYKYPDLDLKYFEALTPVGEPYRGFTIYVSPDGKDYFYSRHALINKSYGTKYKSEEECKAAIDKNILYNPINQQTLIELKTRGDGNEVYLANRFIPGQIIKSLKLTYNTNRGKNLNATDMSWIYNSDQDGGHTLGKFYDYATSIVNSSKAGIKEAIMKVIDTSEKAACFLYAVNESRKSPTSGSKISEETLQSILDEISNAEYEYFVVEEVGEPYYGGKSLGYASYHTIASDGQLRQKPVYRTLLTPVRAADIHNSLIHTDESTGRAIPSIVLLNDLKQKIKDKIGIDIHIENNTSLEEKFEEWGIQQSPEEIRGFVKGGEIYINASTATDQDVFHEFTHIMLGVLRAQNYDVYRNLVDLVAESREAKYVRKDKQGRYPYLAKEDLNEEIFASMFASHLSGKNFSAFMDGKLAWAKRAVTDKMGSIFGAQELDDSFYKAPLKNVFKQFGYDLGELVSSQVNGLEISQGNYFRQASTWIEGQIQKYENYESTKQKIQEKKQKGEQLSDDEQNFDLDSKVGVYKDC